MSETVSFYLEQVALPNKTYGWFAWRSIDSPREEVGLGPTKETAIADLLAATTPELQPISVTDRCPDYNQRCLWWSKVDERWRSAIYRDEDGPMAPGYFWDNQIREYICYGIATHWMPAPPAPKDM